MIPVRHLLRRDHPGKHHIRGGQAQALGHALQALAVRPVANQKQRHAPRAHVGPEAQKLIHPLLLGKPPHKDQHGPLPGNVQAGPEDRAAQGVRFPLEVAEVYARGHHEDGLLHAVALEEHPDLPRGGDKAVRMGGGPAGEDGGGLLSEADVGGEIVGIVLVHRVVGVDQGNVQFLGDAPGQEEGGELALGVDHVGPPLHDLPDPFPRQGGPQPGPGVDQPRRHGAQAGHAVLPAGMTVLGEGQHPDLVAPGLQLPAEILHRGDHAVHRGKVPVGCNQNFHVRPRFSCLKYITGQPGGILQRL